MGAVLIPALIVAAIGLIAAVILVVAARFMNVPVNEKVAAIREVLPGANCGACGYAGCDDYAAAFEDDPDLSPSLCTVGGSDVAAQIAGILGVEAVDAEPKVAVVRCGGSYGVTAEIMKADRIHSCRTAKMFYGGQWACPYGCLGLGDCVEACKFDAIRIENGVARVDRSSCVGCGACAEACPNGIIEIRPGKNSVFVACRSMDKGGGTRKVCTSGCIGCGKCEKVCRFDAVKVVDNVARIDPDACRNCGLCAKECPTGAIVNLKKKK